MRLRLATAVPVAALVLSGCTSGPLAPVGTPTPTGTSAAALPSKVFTDQELMAIGVVMLQQHQRSEYSMDDSQITRTAFDTTPFALSKFVMRPPECGVFHPYAGDDVMKDPSVNFATGKVPLADESSPTTTIAFTIQSAPKDKLAKADFDYADETLSRCAQFDTVYTSTLGAAALHLQLLKPPALEEKAYAMMSPSQDPAKVPGAVVLRVLAGTISISMELGVDPLASEAEAQPALNTMAGFAMDLIDQAVDHPPTLSTPPPNPKTPQQLTDLLQEITGPGGGRVIFASGTVIKGITGYPGPEPALPMTPCTYSDAAYESSLVGSTLVRGEFPAAITAQNDSVMAAGLTVQLISMPTAASPPYPFDRRAADLRDCPTIQEEVFNGMNISMVQWTSVRRPSLNVAADSTFAIAHEHPDAGSGTSSWGP